VEIYTTETTKLSLLLFATNKVMSTLFSTSKCMKDIVPNIYIYISRTDLKYKTVIVRK
jgi:hypothetical protein